MAETDKKTILIATGLYPPDVGGPATYSYLLNQELPRRGWEVKILSFGEVRSWPKIIRHLAYGWKVFRLVRHYQIIYVQDPVSVGLPVCLACALARRSFILKIVGDYAWEQGSQRFGVIDLLDDFSLEYKKYIWPVKLLKLIQRGVARRAQKIIVPSNYLKKIVSNWGVNSDKIKVIYNAFNSPEILPEKEVLQRELGLSGQIIISAGRLVPWKGFTLLIEIMPELLAVYPGLKLYIIGDGPDHDRLEKLITNKEMSGCIFLLGRLAQKELLKFIKAADLFVLNTSYEGFSHQLLEVMWCETPIVTTAVGGNVELIKDKENGLLVNFNDSSAMERTIKSVLADRQLASRLANNAQQTIAGFSRERMITQLLAHLSGT
ncbi:MAG: glycosyltransferase family 4 protein [Candidatus Paceibacterota bacterium]|jgi:glycosyltransferase involved in cell wall biosynthesis